MHVQRPPVGCPAGVNQFCRGNLLGRTSRIRRADREGIGAPKHGAIVILEDSVHVVVRRIAVMLGTASCQHYQKKRRAQPGEPPAERARFANQPNHSTSHLLSTTTVEDGPWISRVTPNLPIAQQRTNIGATPFIRAFATRLRARVARVGWSDGATSAELSRETWIRQFQSGVVSAKCWRPTKAAA